MKILVTGSSGTIGSELVQALAWVDHDVWGLDKKQPEFTHPKDFIEHNLVYPFTDWGLQFDLIIHLAANARVHDLVIDPDLSLENVISTYNVLEYAREIKCPKVIFASSREIYGNGNELPVKDDQGSQRTCESAYAASKLAGEAYCHAYTNCYDIDVKIVRFSNVYGKYDFSNRFMPKIIRQLQNNETVEIWGENKILDFTYITDAVAGVLKLIDAWPEEKEFNIAYGKGEKLVDVAYKMKELMKSKSEIITGPSKTGEVFEYEADISRMKSIGYEPLVDINEGLKKTIEYYANN